MTFTTLPRLATLAFLALAALPAPAQDAAQDLSRGEPVAQANPDGAFILEQHGDWDIRCLDNGDLPDVCRLYQLLKDQNGVDVAEFTMFHLGGSDVEAATNVITPLETLLTQQLTLYVDGANGRRYPFSFCDPVGCYVRAGFTAEDIALFKRGAKAQLEIYPVLNPQTPVQLDVSLTGFTKAYERITELNIASTAAIAEAQKAAAEAAGTAAPAGDAPAE